MQSTHLSATSTRPARPGLTRRVVMAAALFASTMTAACGSDSATAPSAGDVAGAYPMASVRGFPVPHTFTDAAGSKLTVEGGAITIDASGTYALKYKGKLNAITFDLTDEGTYSLSGSTMMFVSGDPDDPPFTGRVQGTTVSVEGFKIAGVKFDMKFTGN